MSLHSFHRSTGWARHVWPWMLVIAAASPAARADERSRRAQEDLFESHVRPTLVARCLRCHGPDKQESGLRVDTLQGLVDGGDSGPAIVPGASADSLLVEALRFESLEMPPDGPVESSVADGIALWVDAGAYWPPDLTLRPTPVISDQDRAWWCYQPIRDPPVPASASTHANQQSWGRNGIDRFILARLSEHEIAPSPEAEPTELVRRVHYALTGLPPDAQTVADVAQGRLTYEELVDRLLDHPAYGENQTRYWLDLVRYADSDGYNADHPRPHAQQYRDYVIRSFNADKPYDRFVMEQLAGDEIDPGNRDALIGTMYLRHWIYEWNQRDVEGQWQEILSDITETTADVFLAQGIKCARCHDHKFDPLPQEDYYRMKAFFAPLLPREDQPVADLETRTRHHQAMQKWEQATEDLRQRLHEIETPVLLAHATREGVGKFVAEIRAMIAMRPEHRGPYEHQIASLASRQFDVHPDKLAEWLTPEAETERQQLLERLSEFDAIKPEPLPTMPFVISDVGPVAPPTHIPGDPEQRDIPPGYPTILSPEPAAIVPAPEALRSTGRRTALARWITDPANPLTARVIVNRIWQQMFGRGLVETASDFGRLGQPPTHPELLDWLATRFVEDGWSIKRLQRRIVLSATYRQTSLRPSDTRTEQLDPQNTLLWRMNPRRLSGEEVHDTLLWASGQRDQSQRAIYKPVRRNRLDPLLKSFDFPDRITSQGQRHRTTTSTQALFMMNAPWVHERAAAMSDALPSQPTEAWIHGAYVRLFARPPTSEETKLALEFLASGMGSGDSETGAGEASHSRVALIHTLMNSSELIYVD